MVTAFAPYKRVDLAIDAFNAMKKPLKIIGTGQDEQRLRLLAGPSIEFLGWQPDHIVRDYYARCRALIFPGEEDFGIVPLEAMACGKPVIAYGQGGVVETVIPINPRAAYGGPHNPGHANPSSGLQPTGVFFYEQSVEALADAVDLLERHACELDPSAIRSHVAPFDRALFKERMQKLISEQHAWFFGNCTC
jgi:glycosyltransferase involved in cell wall biosynthesis